MNIEEHKFKEREYDHKINLLIQQLCEIQDTIVRIEKEQQDMNIRLTEIIAPSVIKIDHYLFGNSKPGLAAEHIICQEKINRHDKMTDRLMGVIITLILQFLFTGAGLAFVYFKR